MQAAPVRQQQQQRPPGQGQSKSARRRRRMRSGEVREAEGNPGFNTGIEYGPLVDRLTRMYGTNPYMAMLIQPKYYQMRYPDEFSRPTALYSSYQYWDVTGNAAVSTSIGDKGKFAWVFRPVLGSLVANASTGQYAQSWNYQDDVTWGSPSLATPANWDFDVDPNSVQMVGTPNAGNTAFTNFGFVRDYRPIAMSVWFKYTGDTLIDGGNIAIALVDGTLLANYFTANPAAPGNLAEYKNLAKVDYAYEGRMSEGVYGFWTPWDTEDQTFKPPFGTSTLGFGGYAEQYPFPSICVSGQATHPGIVVGRFEVITIFEYTTSSRVPDVKPSPVATHLITEARTALQDQPTCMANDMHDAFIDMMLAKVKSSPGLRRGVRVLAPLAGATLGARIGTRPFAALRGAAIANRMAKTLLA